MSLKAKITATTLALLFASMAVLWFIGSSLIERTDVSSGSPPPGIEELTFDSLTGTKLEAWYSEVPSPRAVAIVMHGIGSSRAAMLGRIKLANKLGLSALAFDFQGHGGSGGEVTTFGYLESFDAQAAVSYMRMIEADLPILVIGVSLGGAAALLADPPLEVDGMILEAVYPDIATAIGNRIAIRVPYGEYLTPLLTFQIEPRLGIHPNRLSPAEAAKKIVVPVLVLSGSADLHTTKADTQRLFDSFNTERTLSYFDGAGHVDLERYDGAKYEALVREFIDSHFDPATP